MAELAASIVRGSALGGLLDRRAALKRAMWQPQRAELVRLHA